MNKRARDLGIRVGQYKTGRWNAITDVKGVLVGHNTIIEGHGPLLKPGEGPVRTGVTAIWPYHHNIYEERVAGGSFILNGAGEMSGMIQVQEWGLIETPILLTNTLSVGTVSDACVQYMTQKNPKIGRQHDVVIPLVGECDDSWLNDIVGQHVQVEHVFAALENAKSGPVEEGSVGGGTGMQCCDFKGGIGTSSRKLPEEEGGYTVGVLVMSNFGEIEDLRIDGAPIGKILAPKYEHLEKRRHSYGSIIVVVATDAPMMGMQLNRLAKRAALGIGRVGSYAAHGSGEIVLAFSTANHLHRHDTKRIYKMNVLYDKGLNPLYKATIEATEEAILNSLFVNTDMIGAGDRFCPAIPIDEVETYYQRFREVFT
jgi:D-aminopeptidase